MADPAPWSDDRQPADRRTDDDAARHRPVLTRGLAALGTAAVTGWLSATVLSHSLIAPLAAALLAAVLATALPRIGWVTVLGFLTVAAAVQQRPGAAILMAVGALVPILLLPRNGQAWSLAAGGPALAMIALGGAWPALAAHARTPWQRAALGATGWVWIVLAAPLRGAGLYLGELPGIEGLHSWSGSVNQAVTLVLRPILSSGVLAAAPVWALAALTLPWLVRGRSLTADALLAVAWATALTVGTTAATGSAGVLTAQSAILGAIAAAVTALVPSLRTARARPQVP